MSETLNLELCLNRRDGKEFFFLGEGLVLPGAPEKGPREEVLVEAWPLVLDS